MVLTCLKVREFQCFFGGQMFLGILGFVFLYGLVFWGFRVFRFFWVVVLRDSRV